MDCSEVYNDLNVIIERVVELCKLAECLSHWNKNSNISVGNRYESRRCRGYIRFYLYIYGCVCEKKSIYIALHSDGG